MDIQVEKGEIPHYDPKSEKGYQRPPSGKRVKDLADDLLKNRVDIPTALLISVREKPEDVLTKQHPNARILDLSDVGSLYIVDGQHRFYALKQVLEAEGTPFPATYKLPFVCMVGGTEAQEMEQFHVVNSTSKSVNTGLAHTLLLKRHKIHGNVREALVEKGKEWQLDGQNLLEALNARSPIWRGKIKFTGAKKGDNAGTVIPSASMVTSFKPIFSQSSLFVGIKDVNKQAQVLDAYWEGIKVVLPDAFADSRKYSIQKGVGVRVLHGIFPSVLERVRANGSFYDKQQYADILEAPLSDIQGENASGKTVYGADFWLAGQNEGAAWNFSNGAGIRILISQIRQELPEIDIQ